VADVTALETVMTPTSAVILVLWYYYSQVIAHKPPTSHAEELILRQAAPGVYEQIISVY